MKELETYPQYAAKVVEKIMTRVGTDDVLGTLDAVRMTALRHLITKMLSLEPPDFEDIKNVFVLREGLTAPQKESVDMVLRLIADLTRFMAAIADSIEADFQGPSKLVH